MDAALSIIRWPSGAGRYRHGKVVIYVSALALQSRIVAFTCSYSHYFQDWRYEDLTVTNSAFFRAFCGTDNRLDDLFFIGFLNHRRDHRLWQRGPCSRCGATAGKHLDALLLATTVYVLDVKPTASDSIKRVDDYIDSVGSNDSFYLYHAYSALLVGTFACRK